MPISSGRENKARSAKTAHVITMTDMSKPHKATVETHGDGEEDVEFEELLDDELEEGWTDVTMTHEVPEKYVKKNNQQVDTKRLKEIQGKLQDEVMKAAPLLAEASTVIVRTGAGILAEGIGYVRREAFDVLINNMPTPSDVKTALFARRERNRSRSKVEQLRSTWSHPPDPRITDPRDAPPGTNLDCIAIMGTGGVVDGLPRLQKNNCDEGEGEMKDVPLRDEEDENGDEDEDEEWQDCL